MDSVSSTIHAFYEVVVLFAVLWGAWKSNQNSDKVDMLTSQTNGMAKHLAEGNRAIGAAEARAADKIEASRDQKQ